MSVSGWWVVEAPSGAAGLVQGTAPSSSSTPTLTSQQLKGLGVKNDKGLNQFFLGSTAADAANNVGNAIGQLDLNISVIPILSAASLTGLKPGALASLTSGVLDIGTPITGSSTSSAYSDAGKGLTNAVDQATSWEQALQNFFNLITSVDFWKGAGLCGAGAILVLLGLKQMTGGSFPSVKPAAMAFA